MGHRRWGFMASASGGLFDGWSTEKIVSSLAELGYSAVSWNLRSMLRASESLEDEVGRLVEVTREGGLEISEFVVQQDLVVGDEGIRQTRIEFADACIRAAADVGVSNLNMFTGPAPWDPGAPRLGKDVSEGEAWDMVIEGYSRFLPVAEEGGVNLCVEPVFGHLVHDYYTARELFRHLESPALAINMDPSHYVLYRNDIPWTVRQWGDQIKHVHLKDAVGRPGMPGEDFCFPLLGEGAVDWRAFFDALDDIGYDGFMTVEFESFAYYRRVLQDPSKAAALSIEQLRVLEGGTR